MIERRKEEEEGNRKETNVQRVLLSLAPCLNLGSSTDSHPSQPENSNSEQESKHEYLA